MKRLLLLFVLILTLMLPQVTSQADEDRGVKATADARAKADASASALSDASASAIGGDMTMKGGNTFAASHGLGDVDIEGCIVTKQWGSFVVSHQYFEYDVFCLADKLDLQGKHTAAAALRCSDKETKKLFGDSCITTWTFKPAIMPAMAVTPNQGVETVVRNRDDEEDDDERYMGLASQLEELQRQIEEAPTKIQVQKLDPQIQEQLDASTTRRARAKQAYQDIIEGKE